MEVEEINNIFSKNYKYVVARTTPEIKHYVLRAAFQDTEDAELWVREFESSSLTRWAVKRVNRSNQERASRVVKQGTEDNVVDETVILDTMLKLLPRFFPVNSLPTVREVAEKNFKIMEDTLGYSIARGRSKLLHGGTGVFLTSGSVPKGALIAFYPGTIYRVFEPILLPSIGNKFVFRCLDGIHVDGNDRGLSKIIYKSCVNRDSTHLYQAADMTWMTDSCIVPWNVGQYVNNHNSEFPANVAYQEVNICRKTFPHSLHRFLPNVWYRTNPDSYLRLVALVSTKNIVKGEEILSTYYNIVH